MSVRPPHFLLYAEAAPSDAGWRFALEPVGSGERLEASDVEPEVGGERLELLALVRGLEALDQPSRVTLVTSSRYVRTGLAYGLDEWRSNGWCWERFGQMSPVKNRDLWQRIDRALAYHALDCRTWRLDPPHDARPQPAARLKETWVGRIRRAFAGFRRGSQLAAAG
jgi:ribonuclease HI